MTVNQLKRVRTKLVKKRDSEQVSRNPRKWHRLTAKIDEIDLQLDILRRGLEVEQT
jgi:hypothetical protein